MTHNRDVIINGILLFITGRDGHYNEWYIGTSVDAPGRLSNRHHVQEGRDQFTIFTAESAGDAIAIKEFFMDRVGLHGDDLMDHTAAQVYVYRKTVDTVP